MWIIPYIPQILACAFAAGMGAGLAWYWFYDTPAGEIWRLKRRMRAIYKEMDDIEDSFDCGLDLVRQISPRYSALTREMTATIARLREIDPHFPKTGYGP